MGAAYTKQWPPLPAVLPTHSTHRASTAPLTETGGWTRWHGDRRWGQAGSGSKRRGWAVVSSWSGLLQFYLTRQAAAAHTSSKPLTDVRLGRMQTVQHGQAQTQGDRGDTEHRTRNGEQGWGDGSLEMGLVSPTLGRTGKIRFVLLVKCPFPGYFLSSYREK